VRHPCARAGQQALGQGETMMGFFDFVEKTPTCWLWKGVKGTTHKIQYGYFSNGTKGGVLAHRHSYQIHKGEIPIGMVIDHLCGNGLCVNPEHLRVVTNKENILRGVGVPAQNSRKTHCKRGHELSPDNVWNRKGRRACKQCDIDYHRRRTLHSRVACGDARPRTDN
jgi:hypothetical protein